MQLSTGSQQKICTLLQQGKAQVRAEHTVALIQSVKQQPQSLHGAAQIWGIGFLQTLAALQWDSLWTALYMVVDSPRSGFTPFSPHQPPLHTQWGGKPALSASIAMENTNWAELSPPEQLQLHCSKGQPPRRATPNSCSSWAPPGPSGQAAAAWDMGNIWGNSAQTSQG